MMRSESKRSSTRKIVSPRAIERRSESWKFTLLPVVHAKDGQEGLLRDLDGTDPLHPLLAFFLLLEELALAGDVAAVALGQHVLAHRPDRLAADDMRADCRLDRHFEHLPRDQLLELLDQRLPDPEGLGPMDDPGEGGHRLAADHDVELHQFAGPIAQVRVVEAGIA